MSIPASDLVEITPRVLAGSGTDLAFNGLFLTTSENLPNATLQPFYNATEVADFFGANSNEYTAATCYFNGFDNSDTKPATLFFYKKNNTATPAFVRSAPFDVTNAQLLANIKGITSAQFTITMSGDTQTTAPLDFSAVNSLSQAADILQGGIRNVNVENVAASCTYATAKQAGRQGNNLSIEISESAPIETQAAIAATSDIGTAKTAGAEGNNLKVEVTAEQETVQPAKQATCKYGTAKTAGANGNNLSVVITANATTNTNFDVKINDGESDVFTQENVVAGSNTSALTENEYIEWAADVALTVETVQLSGGADLQSKTVYTAKTLQGDQVVDTQENLESAADLTDNDYITFNKAETLAEQTYTFSGGADAVYSSGFIVVTKNSGSSVDSQTVVSANELNDNDYVTFNKQSALAVGIYQLSGGLDLAGIWQGATVEYASNLDAFTITAGDTGSDVSIENATGAVAEAFYLTVQQGAQYSEGADPQTFTECLNDVLDRGQNFVSLSSIDALTDEEIIEIAQWSNTQYGAGLQFLFVFYSQDARMLSTTTSAQTVAAQLQELNLNGTAGIYGDLRYAAFLMGAIASINWNGNNSTVTLAFKSQAGLGASVETQSQASALEALSMNFIGDYASRNDSFVLSYPGRLFGEWSWIDSYIGSVWLVNALQVQIMSGLQTAKRVPYNQVGYTQIRSWCQDVIERALTNGVISTGVTLSQTQKTELQQQAGLDISNELYNNGYYLQIQDVTAQVRQQRQSPTCGLWYTDAGSVHRISMPVTTVQ